MNRIFQKLCYLILLLILASVACDPFNLDKPHPSDDKLIRNFQEHEAEFNQLLQMFFADKGLGRVAFNFTRPDNPQSADVSQDRINEYRDLFRKLVVLAGIEGYDEKDIVWFHVSAKGLSVTGSTKGYAYVKERPKLVVENLDTYKPKDGRSFTAFRLIKDNWYLYFDYED